MTFRNKLLSRDSYLLIIMLTQNKNVHLTSIKLSTWKEIVYIRQAQLIDLQIRNNHKECKRKEKSQECVQKCLNKNAKKQLI